MQPGRKVELICTIKTQKSFVCPQILFFLTYFIHCTKFLCISILNDISSILTSFLLSIVSFRTTVVAENYLKSVESQPGFMVTILQFISALCAPQIEPQQAAIRQAAAVIFKNAIKRGWEPEDEIGEARISNNDRDTIKSNLIDLMCSTPQDVQRQLAEAVTIISLHDFPANWSSLLPQLVQKLNSTTDFLVIKGVMLTANSIFKRFRNVAKSDALYSDLILCLKGFQEPLTEMYVKMHTAVEGCAGVKDQLIVIMETLRLMTRIFYSLNWQDIPEYFEDNMNLWMTEYAKYLVYDNPLLHDDREEAGPIESLQTAIIENLNLYASKYEEEFQPHLEHFTSAVWQLLVSVKSEPKYDALAVSGIKFLTAVCSKEVNKAMFTEEVLKMFVEKIVVHNLTASESDEELFEDNPQDYIRKDFEGNDQDTRRRCACDLVRGLLKFFPAQVTNLCLGYTGAMLEEYAKSGSSNWKSKDAALHLVLAVSTTSVSNSLGAGSLNTAVNLMDVFQSHVLPEVYDNDVNSRPIVKADSIKLICLFRSHLGLDFMLSILPHITRHLVSENIVIQTYAAICIERFLTVKDKTVSSSPALIKKEHLSSLLNDITTGLFIVLENPDLTENDYVMKCLMRILLLVGSDIGPVVPLVSSKLTASLERVCKNPANPQFNHYLFESLAVLVKSCGTNPNTDAVAGSMDQIEQLLFPPFQAVLSMEVEEFIPYVFQVLAEMLYYRPGTGLSDAYKGLFAPILSPPLWESKGNVPALTDLLKAYITKSMDDIIAGNQLEAVLGIFQKTLAAKSTEMYAFAILDQLIAYNNHAVLAQYIPVIFQLLFRRMMENKTPQYIKLFTHTLSFFALSYGGQVLFEACESIQPDMSTLIITKIVEPNVISISSSTKAKTSRIVVGLSKLLCDSVVSQNPATWTVLCQSIVGFLMQAESAPTVNGIERTFLDDEEHAEAREFDSTYSKLAYASIPDIALSPDAAQPSLYFVSSLSALCQRSPGQYSTIVSACLDDQGKAYLQSLLQQGNLTLA